MVVCAAAHPRLYYWLEISSYKVTTVWLYVYIILILSEPDFFSDGDDKMVIKNL